LTVLLPLRQVTFESYCVAPRLRRSEHEYPLTLEQRPDLPGRQSWNARISLRALRQLVLLALIEIT
jgi:hypothetical protein